ncbi:MAG TPA: Ger(x)C family spore germination protein [Peptococcaceae bacterium]|nr:Ger(x)C family spore germination protein [Peptococcaceae bacterium]
MAKTKMQNLKMPVKEIKVLAYVLLLVFLALFLAGCYDAKEIDQEVYALVIGVDKGVNNAIRITFQVPTYKDGGQGGMGGGGGDGDNGTETGELDGTVVATVEAPSLIEAINILNATSNRMISLSHAKMLVFSEEYAREGVGRYIEPLARFREVRELMRVVVCRGKAEDFIKENKPVISQNIAKDIELSYLQSQNTGYFRDVFFTEFYIDLLSPYGQPTAIYAGVNEFDQMLDSEPGLSAPPKTYLDIKPGLIPRKGGNKKDLFGTAVFDGDRMVGSLNPEETRFFLMSIGEFERSYFTLEDQNKPGYIYVLEVTAVSKPRIKARIADGVPVIDLSLELDADLASIQSRINYEKSDLIEGFEAYLESYFQKGIKNTIEKTQKEFGTDIFQFGKKIAGNFRTIQEFEEYNWLKHYPEAEINVNVKVNVRRSGYFYETHHIFSTKLE